MKRRSETKQYVVCIANEGYRASLVVRRIYQRLADQQAGQRGLVRVIDESGEDYLFPEKMFVAISLPEEASRAFTMAT